MNAAQVLKKFAQERLTQGFPIWPSEIIGLFGADLVAAHEQAGTAVAEGLAEGWLECCMESRMTELTGVYNTVTYYLFVERQDV